MYECPNCGGNLKFDITSQQLACSFCDTHMRPYDVDKETDAVETDYFETTVFTCPQCGGEIFSGDNEAASFCSFCGASTILSSRISKEKRPQYIIPFKKTKEDCKKAYEKKMRFAFFVPDELKDAKHIESFRGIYMPYWTYQLSQNQHVTLNGKKSHRSGDYVITDHYHLTGDLNALYLGYSKDASANFYDNLSETLAPFDAKELVKFTPSYLSGFYADTADVEEDVYLEEVMGLAEENSFERICKEPKFKGYDVDSGKNKNNLRSKLGTVCRTTDRTMYPVWFLSYRNKDRVAYAAVNGQTGKVAVDLPIDMKKYMFTSLILAVIIFVLLNLFLTIKPTTLMMIGCLLALGSAALYAKELNDIYKKEHFIDDLGMQETMTEEENLHEEGKKTKKKKKKMGSAKGFLKKHFITMIWFLIVFGQIGIAFFYAMAVFVWPLILTGTVICGVIGIKKCKKTGDIRKTPGFIVSMIMVGIAVVIRLINPVSDSYYYLGAVLALVAVLFNMMDVISNYNRLVMRRLPQFDRKGGDDRA